MTAADTTHGWKATYRDGVMDPPTARPAAATRGTIVLAEDLFYNVPLRRKALRSASEEYAAILDVVGRYAVYRAGAAIAVKKAGEAKADLATTAGGTRLEAIRAVFGPTVAKNCLPLSLEYPEKDTKDGQGVGLTTTTRGEREAPEGSSSASSSLRCKIEGFVTGADYAGRKTQLILFINGRSVEFPPLKRTLEATYAAILPKAARPFAFLDIQMPPGDVDVNVHPTKKEVAFLHQEELVEAVRTAVEEAVLASNAQRTFKQALLPGAAPPLAPPELDVVAPSYYRPDKLVRTDAKVQTLDAFVASQWKQHPAGSTQNKPQQAQHEARQTHPQQHPTAQAMELDIDLTTAPRRRKTTTTGGVPNSTGDAVFLPTAMEIANAAGTAGIAPAPNHQTQTQPTLQAPVRHRSNPTQSSGLESVQRLLAAAEGSTHDGLTEILRTATFVGLADSHRALIQSGTRLYLIDLSNLTRDMFYQQALRRFGQAPRVALCPAMPAADLALVALEAEEIAGRWEDSPEGGTKEEVAALLAELIQKKAGLLGDCFAIEIDPGDGKIRSLPQLIEQYHPSAQYLPQFVLALGQNVDWQEEGECFRGLAEVLAELFCLHPDAELDEWTATAHAKESNDASKSNLQDDDDDVAELEEEREQRVERERRRREWEAAHVLLPALRLFLRPSRERANDGSVIELTRLEHLYRVFERC